MFDALVARHPDDTPPCHFESWSESQLPDHPVTVQVHYSSLNYKDALAVTGRGKILRNYPIVPGIDLAGTVTRSKDPRFSAGDSVLLCGAGLGEDYSGGYAEYAQVPGDPLLLLPEKMTLKEAMAAGTAGFTAALAVLALEDAGITPERGPVIVSGASGGLGSIAVTLLARLGYQVAAISGRPQQTPYLKQLGVNEVLPRQAFQEAAKPLEAQRWAGAIDTAGDQILAKLLAQTDYGGAVASCGLAGGHELHTTVMPFILRGVKLLGINSTYAPQPLRERAWHLLAQQLNSAFWGSISQTISFRDIPAYAQKLLDGQLHGRVIVAVQPEKPA